MNGLHLAVVLTALRACFQAQMKPLLGKMARKKSSGVEVEDQSADKEKEAAVLPSTQSEAVGAQQSSSIGSAVFYKSSMYHLMVLKPRTYSYFQSKSLTFLPDSSSLYLFDFI